MYSKTKDESIVCFDCAEKRYSTLFSMGAWLFLFAVLLDAGLLFLSVFFMINFSDLECDYLNPIDLCNRLNVLVIPEMAAHGFLTLIFLLAFQPLCFILNAPILAYNVNKVLKGQHMYDATEIFRTLGQHKKETFIKLGLYLVFFFIYLYKMILALVSES